MSGITSDAIRVFDRRAVRRHRDRAAAGLARHDFLLREVAERVADRLDDITRRFPLALDLGCHHGVLAEILGPRGGIETLIQCDLSPTLARAAAATGRPSLVADEEALPFAAGCLDLVLSVLSLHWVNDLPGALLQIRRALRPDGLFLGAMLGGRTLSELRTVLMEAELAEEGGVSPRVSPFADVRDVGNLLMRAGFALPVVDVDVIPVTYPDVLTLMRELRGMGESNAVAARRRGLTRRATLARAAALYAERFAGPDGRLPVTFEVLYLTAWTPAPDQPRPLRPGSARARLADALRTAERPAGDKVPAKPERP
ncbi:MAG: methyltransferase domain-containing protein [Alphaproteobacteria bacterium]|nr:MAG: methyltransferase domain-containing protein [Alphaproteobacteria bacterium]